MVRHKSFSLARETPDEAAFEMEAMDYDFHLFTDLDTGRDSVIYRAGPTGY
ncbi:sigma 54 modulation/S30EA ribosomal C-terminal domain-containing protein [Streptomyces sp. RB6PN25]|uniref:Sigma 54 modulation/S30EA ribosomal C-terminal domain-containing protein n=1 Tax=Streptomyces humicola TaxID=2953240 RepID=A0ABT1Q553_9ACTN|nr:sigma 54 modulation/S30EA ribosomal C-terminal domain-containing protein [Streptomyces humicola]MCQ4083887.1 sigma 54 modulation/S30EA ribosomal C-terminal domain-containing protein [Streptomyces humicola]